MSVCNCRIDETRENPIIYRLSGESRLRCNKCGGKASDILNKNQIRRLAEALNLEDAREHSRIVVIKILPSDSPLEQLGKNLL